MEAYIDLIERIITESDIVLEVVDARLIDLSRNSDVENMIKEIGRPVIFVVNKSDLTSKDKIKKQVLKLKEEGEVVFISAKKRSSSRILFNAIKKAFKKHGKREKHHLLGGEKLDHREAKGRIVVGVVGYPNVGKSSIINILSNKKKVKVSKRSGTTHGIHWIKGAEGIKLIDSPGVIPLTEGDEVRHGLIAAKSVERLKNPEIVADAIIKLFIKQNKRALEKFYSMEIESETEADTEQILENISIKRSHILKGGRPDINRTSMMIVKDWQNGKLRM